MCWDLGYLVLRYQPGHCGETSVSRFAFVCLALLLAACAPRVTATEGDAATRLETVRQSPPELRAFLYRMPKGGDLHSHLSGAAYAEALIDAGAAAGVCVDPVQYAVAPCGRTTRKLTDAQTSYDFRTALIDAWSMRGFVPSSGVTGHDHFLVPRRKLWAVQGNIESHGRWRWAATT